jgi:single-strand DNA-binding protein
MSHSVTGKLNKDARQHQNQSGMTFFVSLGQQAYNHKTKQREWTNYEAALFAKENQVQFYAEKLRSGSIIAVSGDALLVENDPQYGVKLHIQNGKLEFVHSTATPMPESVRQQVQQPPQQQAPQQQPPMQQAPQQQPAQGYDNFDQDIPF